jgi:hypothetical protein
MIWLSVLLFMQASAANKQIERGQTLFFADEGLRHVSRLERQGYGRRAGSESAGARRRASPGHRHPRFAHGVRRDHQS